MALPFYTITMKVGGESSSYSCSGFVLAFGGEMKVGTQRIPVDLVGGTLAVFVLVLSAILLCTFYFTKLEREMKGMLSVLIGCILLGAMVPTFMTYGFVQGGLSLDFGFFGKVSDSLGVGAILSGILFCLASIASFLTGFLTLKK